MPAKAAPVPAFRTDPREPAMSYDDAFVISELREMNQRIEKLTNILLILLAYNRSGDRPVINLQRIHDAADGKEDMDRLIDLLCGDVSKP